MAVSSVITVTTGSTRFAVRKVVTRGNVLCATRVPAIKINPSPELSSVLQRHDMLFSAVLRSGSFRDAFILVEGGKGLTTVLRVEGVEFSGNDILRILGEDGSRILAKVVKFGFQHRLAHRFRVPREDIVNSVRSRFSKRAVHEKEVFLLSFCSHNYSLLCTTMGFLSHS